MSANYEPRFDFDLQYGEGGERFAHELLHTEQGRCEVKTDRKALETGNLYVEYRCRGRDGVWRNSGIATTEAELFCYVIGQTGFAVLAKTEALRYVARVAYREGRVVECIRGSNPTQGVLLSLSDVIASAGTVPFWVP